MLRKGSGGTSEREKEKDRDFLQSEETDYYTPRRDGGVAILDKRELRLHITRLPVMLATTFYARPND